MNKILTIECTSAYKKHCKWRTWSMPRGAHRNSL